MLATRYYVSTRVTGESSFSALGIPLWNEHYGSDRLPEHILHVGLYQIHQNTYGPLYGNNLMDYAMYSILEQFEVSMHFPERMAQRVIFSKDCPSDSWLSDFF